MMMDALPSLLIIVVMAQAPAAHVRPRCRLPLALERQPCMRGALKCEVSRQQLLLLLSRFTTHTASLENFLGPCLLIEYFEAISCSKATYAPYCCHWWGCSRSHGCIIRATSGCECDNTREGQRMREEDFDVRWLQVRSARVATNP